MCGARTRLTGPEHPPPCGASEGLGESEILVRVRFSSTGPASDKPPHTQGGGRGREARSFVGEELGAHAEIKRAHAKGQKGHVWRSVTTPQRVPSAPRGITPQYPPIFVSGVLYFGWV